MERDAASEDSAALDSLRCPRCASALSRLVKSEAITVKTRIGDARSEITYLCEKRECVHCGQRFSAKRQSPGDADPKPKPLGVACPNCKSTNLSVVHTRRYADRFIRERRCKACGREKIYTMEKTM
jgi:Zn finger protein HypA/HybF involved in hydrogenase expression